MRPAYGRGQASCARGSHAASLIMPQLAVQHQQRAPSLPSDRRSVVVRFQQSGPEEPDAQERDGKASRPASQPGAPVIALPERPSPPAAVDAPLAKHVHRAASPAPSAAPSSGASMTSPAGTALPHAERKAVHRPSTKVIGLGSRGASSVNRLAASSHLEAAEFWAIDTDRKVLSSMAPGVHSLEVLAGDDVSLHAHDLAAIAGEEHGGTEGTSLRDGPRPTGSSRAAGFRPDGASGAVFVLGSALGTPGGATLMLQLVNHLRRQGFFVAVALTRPFQFEGARKLEQADALVETLEEVAHLVVVVDQGVLTRASPDMTMPQASSIADKTLQYTVRSIVWALRAPEILKVSDGAFLWHGRDLRALKRPLFPPMMSLLTCPGHGYLGRGQAALPSGSTLQEVSLASMLSTLAEDATRAAAESPFLDGHMASATAALCILIFPKDVVHAAMQAKAARTAGSPGKGTPSPPPAAQSMGTYNDNYREYALRSAVQVAALTVRELVGPRCRDVVVCPQVKEADVEEGQQQHEQAPQCFVECALLVIKSSADATMAATATPAKAGVGKGSSASPSRTSPVRSASGSPADSRAGSAHGARVTAPPPPRPAPAAHVQPPAGARKATERSMPFAPTTHSTATTPAAPSAPSVGAPPSAASVAGAGQPPTRAAAARPNWQAMSVIAGGSAAAAHNIRTPPSAPAPVPPPAVPRAGPRASAAAVSVAKAPSGLPTHRRQIPQQPRPAPQHVASSSAAAPSTSPPPCPQHQPQPPSAGRIHAPAGGVHLDGSVVRASTASMRLAGSGPSHRIPRMSGMLVTALVAQSLDLPPQAARWRHQQRTPCTASRDYIMPDTVVAADQEDSDAAISSGDEEGEEGFDEQLGQDEEGGAEGTTPLTLAARLLGRPGPGVGGAGSEPARAESPRLDVKSRVAGMLVNEREHLA